MPHLRLLLVHVPKTGGSSLKKAMKRTFGERLFKDYGAPCHTDEDLARSRAGGFAELEGREAVIGHVSALKYAAVDIDRRVTVLREPVERAISHFFHFRSLEPRSPLWAQVHSGAIGLNRFVATPEVRWIYSRRYFRDTDMSAFEVIAHDHLANDWDGVLASLGLSCPPQRRQDRRLALPDYHEQKAAILGDRTLMEHIEGLLEEDIAFYRQWAPQPSFG